MMKPILSALVVTMALSVPAFADQQQSQPADAQSSLKIKDVSGQKNKVPGDIDQEITNAKLRAESGSKSRYSLSALVEYDGGSMETPLSANRPNITHDAVPAQVKLVGDLEARYRFNEHNSVSVGIGYELYQPLQKADYSDMSNPYVNYHYAGKMGMFQHLVDVGPGFYTSRDYVAAGYVGDMGVTDTIITDFHGSRWSLGLLTYAEYDVFNKDDIKLRPNQQDYTIQFYPDVEYAINDTLSLRTLFRPWIYNHTRGDNATTLAKAPWTQSVGLSIAVARNFYLYPNFQFNWETWRANDFNFLRKDVRATSTVGLQANINVF